MTNILSNNKDIIFGAWDYISHQVIASSFKPIDYINKMDLFGFKYISGFNTIFKYLAVENKRDIAKIDEVD